MRQRADPADTRQDQDQEEPPSRPWEELAEYGVADAHREALRQRARKLEANAN